ncbi:uncharacterized protein LOC111137564 isoform X2 [Crassostrea virginica]
MSCKIIKITMGVWSYLILMMLVHHSVTMESGRRLVVNSTCLELAKPSNEHLRLSCNDLMWYHCLLDESYTREFEFCKQWMWIVKGDCAYFNSFGDGNIDRRDCKEYANLTCSPKEYPSYKNTDYSACYAKEGGYREESRPKTTTWTPVNENATSEIIQVTSYSAESGDSGIVLGVVIVVVLIVIAALVAVYILDKRNEWKLLDRLRASVTGLWDRIHREPNEIRNVEGTGIGDNEQDMFLPQDEVPQSSENTEKDQEDMFWKLNILKQYLVVTLKWYCGIEELKDAKVLYNASLVKHFPEALLKPLLQLNSIDDHQKLDYCLVYNLLRNVCKHVKPPGKGWDYEPAVDDISLGADIERIRLFWNRYCDEKEDDMHSCDMILKRMKNKFGDISGNDEGVNSDEWKMRKEKITSVELQPDCQVEDSIVLTKGIKDVVERLEKENLVIVKGVIGSGKSTCLNYIDKYYKRKQWEVKRKEEIIRRADFCVEENNKILLCCDNLFGAYNRGNFAGTPDIIESLENHDKKGDGELKVVLAIHDHVFDELEECQTAKILRNKSVIVDLNKMEAAENLLIFKEQRNRGHCARDRQCWFRNIDFARLQATLKENPGLIGDPLLTLIYCNHHDIFTKKEDTRDIMKALCSLFVDMLTKSPDLFHVLVYVMCIKTHDLNSDVPGWAAELGGLSSEKVKRNIRHLDSFLECHVGGRTIRMKHDLFNIALFKVCSGYPDYLTFLMSHCHFEMIEEMLRPTFATRSEFCVLLNEESFKLLVSRLKADKLSVRMNGHPLMSNLTLEKKVTKLRPSKSFLKK